MVNTEQLRRRLLETFGRDHSVSSLEAAARAAGRDFSQVRAMER
jgi:predicted transcriptional regulator